MARELGAALQQSDEYTAYNVAKNAADSDAYALKTQLEESYANKVRRQVYEALVDFYGAENLKVPLLWVRVTTAELTPSSSSMMAPRRS